MTKHILEQYADCMARVKYLRDSISRISNKLARLEKEGAAVDSVSCGKKGKRPLKNVVISGFPQQEHDRLCELLARREEGLKREEQELLQLTLKTEEYISSIPNKEMRNIMSLYYVEELNWVQVAQRMNGLYRKKTYTESSCRNKHERFLKNLYG